jgi:hypothetical protein
MKGAGDGVMGSRTGTGTGTRCTVQVQVPRYLAQGTSSTPAVAPGCRYPSRCARYRRQLLFLLIRRSSTVSAVSVQYSKILLGAVRFADQPLCLLSWFMGPDSDRRNSHGPR